MPTNSIRYRILSFDGGGIRGIVTVIFLQRLLERIPNLLSTTDLLSGTSTGGIIALALAKGISLAELHSLYAEHGKDVFHRPGLKAVGEFMWAKYSQDHFKTLLQEIFGDATLGHLSKKVVIPTFDLDNTDTFSQMGSSVPYRTWKPKFFHNFEGGDSDSSQKVVDVALSATAAPTYFPSYHGYIDGGVVANNPSMAALAQTQDFRAHIPSRPALSEIALLSLGTGILPRYEAGPTLDWGWFRWAKPIVSLMLDGDMGIADYQCFQILGNSNYKRFAPVLPPDKQIEMDDWRRVADLEVFAEHVIAGREFEEVVSWLGRGGW